MSREVWSRHVTLICVTSAPIKQGLTSRVRVGRPYCLAAQMYRGPARPQRSPGASRPPGRSPASGWGFPGARFSGHRGASPRGFPAYSPGSPAYTPGSDRGYREWSPSSFGGRPPQVFGGQMRRRGDGFRRPQSFSPNFQVKFQMSCLFRNSSGFMSRLFINNIMLITHVVVYVSA